MTDKTKNAHHFPTPKEMVSPIVHHPVIYFFGLVIICLVMLGLEEHNKKILRHQVQNAQTEKADIQEKYYDLAELKSDPNSSLSMKNTIKLALKVHGSDLDWRIISAILCLEHHYKHFDSDGKVLRVQSKRHKGMEFVGSGSLLVKKGTKYLDDIDIEDYDGHLFYVSRRFVELIRITGSIKGALLKYSNNSPTYPGRIYRIASKIKK